VDNGVGKSSVSPIRAAEARAICARVETEECMTNFDFSESMNRLRALGLGKLADAVLVRRAAVRIERKGILLFVWAPEDARVAEALDRVPGCQWSATHGGARVIPASESRALILALQETLPGEVVSGTREAFEVAS
jgi:hypothetical protein